MYPRAPAGHRRHDIVRLLSGSVYLCVHVGMCVCVCVKKCKEGNKSWMHRGTTGGSPGVRRQEVS